MSYDWFRFDGSMVDHPKVFELEAELGEDRAGWYVVRLWSWLKQYAARGVFAPHLAPHVERACGWRGESKKLIAALVKTGWLDVLQNGDFEAHDWWEKQGALVAKAEKDSEKKRQMRRAPKSRRFSAKTADGARTEQNRTEQDVTEQDEEKQAPLRVASPPVGELVDVWNGLPHPPFPACHAVTGKRLRAAQARLREVPDIDRWRKAVARLPTSPFLRGENDRGWVATLDWLLRPDTLTKLEEGAYDTRGAPRGPTLVTPGAGALQATIGEML